jgi:hypothetical protein
MRTVFVVLVVCSVFLWAWDTACAGESGQNPLDNPATIVPDSSAGGQDGRLPVRLEWTSPHGELPGTYADYLRSRPLTSGQFRASYFAAPARSAWTARATRFRIVSILIDESLYNALAAAQNSALEQYQADLAAEGYVVQTETVSGGTPQDIKAWVQQRYAQGCETIVFIGDITAAWAQVSEETFPCDLYYMDTDGYWADTDGDGDFDVHSAGSGDEGPEVCVARLYAHSLSYDSEVAMVSTYLEKAHKYRAGTLTQPWRALEYIDHDWYDMDVSTRNMFGANVARYDLGCLTTAEDYLVQLALGQYYVQLAAHGYSGGFVLHTIPTESVVYAHTYIHSPSTRPALLSIGSDDGIQVLWNGSTVLTRDEYREWEVDTDRATVTLNSGWNRLLCKVSQGGSTFGFSAKLTDLMAEPYADLAYRVTNPDTHPLEGEFVRGWLINGFHQDIPDNFWSYIDTNYLGINEATIAPTAGQVTHGKTWINRSIGSSYVDFEKLLGSHDYGACYAAATVNSQSPRNCQIWLGYDDGVKVWLNGRMVLSDNRYGDYAPDMKKVNVTLNAGANRLLVKVTEWAGQHGFSLRFCTTNGTAISGLTYDPAPDPITYIGTWALSGPYLNEDQATRLSTDYLGNEGSVRPSVGDAGPIGTWQLGAGEGCPFDLGACYDQVEWVHSEDIQSHDPPVLFYNLFVCSGSRFTDPDFLAGSHIFNTTYGLCAVGSSKTGSMLNFADFTAPLGLGETIGAAFLQWFDVQAPFEEWEKQWYYGMVLSGDPTLRLFYDEPPVSAR